MVLDFVSDGETSHHLVDLDLDLVTHLRIWYKDHKSFNPGNAVAFASNVLNLDIVFFSDLYRGRSAHGGSTLVIIRQKPSPSGKTANQTL